MADRKVTVSLFGDDRDLDQKISDAKKKLDALKAANAKIPISIDKAKFDVAIREAENKLDDLNRKKASPKIDTAKASLDLDKLDLSIDKTLIKMHELSHVETTALVKSFGELGSTLAGSVVEGADEAGTSLHEAGAKLGALSNFAIPALIGGLVALSGQVVTVGFGLASFGAAAFKDVDPIIKAAQATGGLAANLGGLDPMQRKAALGMLVLGDDFSKFAKTVEPQVFSVFNKGLSLANDLLTDTSPIAKVAGNALSSVVGSIDKEFQSGEWQSFFGYIEKNAGPDIKQLGMLFTDLLGAIPPLAEAMHPLGAVLINDFDDIVKFTGGVSSALNAVERSAQVYAHLGQGHGAAANSTSSRAVSGIKKAAMDALNPVQAAVNLLGQAGGWAEKVFGGSDKAASGQQKLAIAAKNAAIAAQKEQQSMDSLAASLNKVIDKTLELQGDDVSWHQAMLDANDALKKVKGSLDGNSRSALNAKQALITMTQAAEKSADDQITLHHNIAGANTILNRQIAYLEEHAGKSKFAQTEIRALITAENAIPHNITSTIHTKTAAAAAALAKIINQMNALNGMTSVVAVDYTVGGQSYVVQHHRHTAKGWLVSGGVPNKDSVPIMAMPGEAVVPKRLVPAVAPFLKSKGVPGFADGGFIGSGFPDFAMPNFSGVGGNSNSTITIQLVGSDSKFMSALASTIRSQGGDPAILSRKVQFA